MKIPGASEAIVPERKLTEYLLSKTHPRGKSKAAFFLGLGFSDQDWRVLAKALKDQALGYDFISTEDTPFGTWYTVEGELNTPIGIQPWVRTVWFIDTGAVTPRFVTAYPISRSIR